jgi:VanZ family protein
MRPLSRTAPAALAASLLLLAAPRDAHAQAADSSASPVRLARSARLATRDDSLGRGAGDDAMRAHAAVANTLHKWRRGPSNAGLYGLLLTGGVVYNLACPLGTLCDRDRGGYVDTYRTIDKVAHASTAAALTSFAIQGGVQPEAATFLTIAAGVAFELTQTQGGGYYSGRDVVANSTGAVLAWGWHRASTWRRGRAERDTPSRNP